MKGWGVMAKSRVDDKMDAEFAHLTFVNLARWKRWKHCSFGSQQNIITIDTAWFQNNHC